MNITRREFIKSLALNSAVAAASTLFPGISFGAWKQTEGPAGMIQWKKTPCRFCGTGCSLLVGVSGDRALGGRYDLAVGRVEAILEGHGRGRVVGVDRAVHGRRRAAHRGCGVGGGGRSGRGRKGHVRAVSGTTGILAHCPEVIEDIGVEIGNGRADRSIGRTADRALGSCRGTTVS